MDPISGLSPKPVVRRTNKGPLSSRSLLELSLFSGFIFVFSALLMQFLFSLWTMLLLHHFGINFQYSLFHIVFDSYSGSKWSETMIYLVFASGPLLLTVAGMVLLQILKSLKKAGWKTKLIITWLAFLFVNNIPFGILAGTLFYDGFGMAFFWLIDNLPVRGIIALLVLVVLVLMSRFWYRLFLKTAYTKAFLESGDGQKRLIVSVFLIPWVFGMVILLGFNWPFITWYWPAFYLSLGHLAITLVGNSAIEFPHRISKSDKKIFARRYQILLFAIATIVLWVAGKFNLDF